jgi:RNA polymerase sigma factor (sigma-70 family)
MRSRSSTLETFTTFLQFEDDFPRTWTIDGRLQRSMQKALQQLERTQLERTQDRSPKTDRFWALYWHKKWSNPPQTPGSQLRNLPFEHLSAYLQEPCFWAVNRMRSQFTNTQYSLSDCFQIAVVRVEKILTGFDAQQGFGLSNYASTVFGTALRDALRQKQEVDICSNWSLLRKTSQKRVSEALYQAGLSDSTIAQYTLAWQTFKALYVPTQASGTRQLPRPDEETWQRITTEYNRQTPTTKADRLVLEQWLNKTAQALRNYLNPGVVSMNAPRPGQEEGEWQDNLTDSDEPDSLLANLIDDEDHQERLDKRSQLETVLEGAIEQCDPELRSILQLYYGTNLTQQQMATQLNIKQYTISRRLTKAKETLLKQLTTWSQTDLHICLTPDVLQTMGTLLDDWLKTRYHRV